ncbi:hypothetical protein HDU83_000437 [Entophlyctis luteolus]|nr:hypothetical protein HDU82_007261 [Entophlyctis luteolus]KAJ3349519.1 hypothetical protein HDU83_000437 [Entophlyctis luteolus]
MDCAAAGVDCTTGTGGQYDDVKYVHCGKEPYSGVSALQTGDGSYVHYVQQTGDGIFCIRICAGDQGTGDSCNAKLDSAGCYVTMNYTDQDMTGFSYADHDVNDGARTPFTPSWYSSAPLVITATTVPTATTATIATTAGTLAATVASNISSNASLSTVARTSSTAGTTNTAKTAGAAGKFEAAVVVVASAFVAALL